MRHIENRGMGLLRILLALALIAMAPVVGAQDEPGPVVVTINVSGNAVPGGTVTATATVEINDGSTLQGFAWMQTEGVEVAISGAGSANTVMANFPGRQAFKNELLTFLSEPPIGPDELPPNVPFPDAEEFPAGLQDRWQPVGINPFSLEEAGLVVLEVEVTTTSGIYHAETEIHTALPWKPTASIRNVPVRVPVLLQGKEQEMYNWRLERPAGSNAGLSAAATRNPEFVPDIAGIYTVRVTDEAAGEPVAIEIYAGYWRGLIVDQDEDGRPVVEEICTACHRSGFAPDLFTPWAQTGHAEIFTNSLNTNTHYSSRCFSCHTVGYDTGRGVNNGGVDEADDYQAFLDAGLIANASPDNWTTVLEDFPETARMANVQCENCHGPQESNRTEDTLAHGWRSDVEGAPRASLSSDVCATCHGEPLRHARFQQWQLSGHANYELAIDEAGSGSCSRCHTANGFLTWLPVLLGDEPGDPLDSIEVTWTADEAHPQTCQTCHDPHSIGTTSGSNPNATVRISGNTPELIAGFQVIGAGKAAICMTCHNSRRGLRNDDIFPDIAGTSEAARAPHGGSQTDLLMGENAYFVNVGVRGPHSLVGDSCVACHMEATPPPDALSYNQGGTNHTFFASPDICADCHGEIFDGETLQEIFSTVLADVKIRMEQAWIDELAAQIDAGNTLDLDGTIVADIADIASVNFGEFRGRQSLEITMADGTLIGPLRIPDIDVVQPAPMPTVGLHEVASDDILKAGWNWNLINNDGSKGVHNPSFALEVLDAARDAISDGAGGPRTRLPW